ncbi:MAG TPA: ion channel [Ktedonobacterales bacterium]
MLIFHILVALAALLLIGGVLWDAFETMVLPRRVSHRLRLSRLFFGATWKAFAGVGRRMRSTGRREALLAVHGPLMLLLLLAVWMSLLIVGFALLQWGFGSALGIARGISGLGTDLYFSGTTLLTLGLGDVVPQTGFARLLTVLEVGTGFGVLALTIGYLPVLYQAFSRREVSISLLDAHAGSPPTAGALLQRHPPHRHPAGLAALFADWERWSAELLESHLSYSMLAYFRTQHDAQSWVASLTAILDACALILAAGSANVDEALAQQASFTFAMARHVAVDLSQVLGIAPRPGGAPGRLQSSDHARFAELLAAAGIAIDDDHLSRGDESLAALRALYEPFMTGLADYLLTPLPPWLPQPDALDDWQSPGDLPIASLLTHAH